MILLIDNYDSFTYNLYQFIGSMNPNVKIIRNDQYSWEEIKQMKPERIVISPGPGKPKNAGVCEEVILKLKEQIPILGVCLGHQAICETFGGKIIHAKKLMHGKTSSIEIDTKNKLFRGLKEEIKVARYHSLAVSLNEFPDCLKVIGKTKEDEIMAVKHKDYEIYGVQFHPESILTENGIKIIENFLV